MSWNNWVRQIHRWLSIAFTVTVIANFVLLGLKKQVAWVTYAPLLPLAFLLLSGLYLFVLPYAIRRRTRQHMPDQLAITPAGRRRSRYLD